MQYEIIFCIQDEAAHELINVVNGLIAKYPDVDAKVYTGTSYHCIMSSVFVGGNHVETEGNLNNVFLENSNMLFYSFELT